MQRPVFDLAKVLRPIEPEAFFRDHYEKKPLHVARNDADYYRGLFSLRDLDEVIAFSRPKFVEPGDFKPNGPPIHPYVQGWLADDDPFPTVLYPTVAEVHQAYLRGKTVILTATQLRWPASAALCRNLEAVFGCPVHANMYLTPKGRRAFTPISTGMRCLSCNWRGRSTGASTGRAATGRCPTRTARWRAETLGPVTQEVFVRPGDMLYMPRGHVHEAFTSDQASMHLTIGVKVYRMADLLRLALDAVSRRDVRFREAVPPGVLPSGMAPPSLKEKFGELLQALAEGGRVDEAVNRLASGFVRKLAPLPGDFFYAEEDAERLTLDTTVEKAPGVVHRIIGGEGWVGIEFPGNRIDGPPKIAAALEFMARTPRFTPRSLPDDLTADAKLLLVRRLVRARFLTPRLHPGTRAAVEGGAAHEELRPAAESPCVSTRAGF